MADLFIRFNSSGVIQHVYFDYLFFSKPQARSVFSLFSESTNELISRTLTETSMEINAILDDETYPVILLRSSMQINFLYLSTISYDKKQLEEIKHLFDLVINDFLSQKSMIIVDSKGFYEQMQILNNELVNKTRIIEKMNGQLNILNLKQEELLKTDPLTQLISRYVYPQQIESKIKEFPEKKGLFCYLDIDDFKSVNDTLGHKAGDEYLVEFAKRLNALPIENSLKMRIAGDEFGLFIYNLDEANIEQCEQIWKLLQESVAKPIKIGNHVLSVAFSLGFAVFPDDNQDIHLLFDNADKAMYLAKKRGNNLFACYNCVKNQR
jgi:diguanylate cyclase (GGDEF)-like protein